MEVKAPKLNLTELTTKRFSESKPNEAFSPFWKKNTLDGKKSSFNVAKEGIIQTVK